MTSDPVWMWGLFVCLFVVCVAAHQNEACAGITAGVGRVALGVSQRTEGDQEDFSASEREGEEAEEWPTEQPS